MAKYRSNNPKRTVNKVRPGTRTVNKVKSSNFLPTVFQTDLNKKWLDSTFDQMISKADLEDIDAYVGSRSGKYRKATDTYLYETAHVENRVKKQLEPGITTKDTRGNIVSKLSVDDIANAVNFNFDEYNYNAAYSTESYVFTPPINKDMFVNYSSYYWINNMPEYESTNTGVKDFVADGSRVYFEFVDGRVITSVTVDGVAVTAGVDFDYDATNTSVTFYVAPTAGDKVELTGSAISYTIGPISDSKDNPIFTITDDNGVFELQEGMLIKWGAGYTDTYTDPVSAAAFSNDKVYMVAGVGDVIKFIEYKDDDGIIKWADYTQYKEVISDYWDDPQVNTISMRGPVKRINSILTGETYEIWRVGNTNWNLLANDSSPYNAGSFVIGNHYKIASVGTTDFTLIGAASNTVGVIFEATGTGSGTGTATRHYVRSDTFVAAVNGTVAGQQNTTGLAMRMDIRAKTPRAIATNYNSLTPAARGAGLKFNFSELQKTSYLENGMLVAFDEDWDYTKVATSVLSGRQYIIETVGTTDFTTVGAASNTPGLVFTATGTPTGTGTVRDELDKYRIFQVQISSTTGNITFNRLLGARYDASGNIEQFIPGDLTEIQLEVLESVRGEWDTEGWDSAYYPSPTKDYIIQQRNDEHANAWVRCNQWIHRDTILTLMDLIPSIVYEDYINDKTQARRPILQFDSKLHLMNHGTSRVWHGMIDFVFANESEKNAVQDGITFVLENDANIYEKITVLGNPDKQVIGTMAAGDTFLPLGSPQITETNPYSVIPRETWKYRDAYFDGTTIQVAQIKARPNQPILFKLNDNTRTPLDDSTKYPESNFKGNKLLSYKTTDLQEAIDYDLSVYGYVTGLNRDQLTTDWHLYDDTVTVDSEIQFPLVYKDMGKGADYVFENNINTRRYNYTVQTSSGNTSGKKRTIPGYYFFFKNLRTRHNYRPSLLPSGAREQINRTVTSVSEDYVIDIGYDEWRPQPSTSSYRNEFLVFSYGANYIALASITSKGVYNVKPNSDPFVILEKGATYKFHDLIGTDPSYQLTFYEVDGTTVYSTGVTRTDEDGDGFAETVTLIAPSTKNYVLKIGYPGLTGIDRRLGRFVTVDSTDYLWHKLCISGVYIEPSNYTITANSITIPKELLTVNDIIDLDYYPNNVTTSTNTQVPDVHSHNGLNATIDTFTISETLDHWTSLLRSTPDFEGQAFGFNNAHKRIKNNVAGGEIFIHNNISVMHDLNYADETLNLSSALNEQGKDWWTFKKRFESQVKRLYRTNSYTSVREIVDDALEQIVSTKRGTEVHKYSNMLYAPNNQYDTIYYTTIAADTLTTGVDYTIVEVGLTDWTLLGASSNTIGVQFTATGVDSTTALSDIGYAITEEDFSTKFTANADIFQRDHLYVYLIENIGGTMIERQLVKDVDYTMDGSIIQLSGIPAPGPSGTIPSVTVYWHDMDSESYIPSSMAKLGLTYRSVPTLYTNIMLGHDGTRYDIDSSRDFYNPNAANFDLVMACYYELEKRAYCGLVDIIDNRSWEGFIPSQHRETWYTYADINNYIEKFFVNWWVNEGKPDLTPSGYYTTDSRTWNYSTIDFSSRAPYAGLEHLEGNTLPGHWRGAYVTLFGTDSPHLTPWNMLGIDSKPSWWDTHYPSPSVSGSWAAGAKRDALINSLQKGIINDPSETYPVQDIRFARYYWDWTNYHPVKTDGSLEDRGYILGMAPTPGAPPNDPLAASQEFVFGDWGPVEIDWRNSSLGQSAMVDAMIKFNPARAYTTFFQPGYFRRSPDYQQAWLVSRNSEELIKPTDLYYHGKTYGKIVKRIEIRDVSDGWGVDSRINILNGDSTIVATATVDVDSTGTVKHITLTGRGIEYVDDPILDIINDGIGKDASAYIDTTVVLTEKPFYSNGLCQVQYNALQRNYFDTDLEQQYYSLDTQLLQKVGGFTNKNLLAFYTESGSTGAFRISESDYENYMYKGITTELNVASIVTITKNTTSYSITGVSPGKQQFRFFEPVKTGNDFRMISVLDQAQIRHWNRFSTTSSILEFDAQLNKVQDVYDFIRGYFSYLVSVGFTLDSNVWNAEAQAIDFATWAVEADTNETYTIYLPRTMDYTATHGHIVEFNTMRGGSNTLLSSEGRVMPLEHVVVTRNENTMTISMHDPVEYSYNTVWGAVAVAELDYEHAIIFNNITQFNETLYNSVLNQRQWRLKLNGKRTRDWDGRRTAPGYLIQDNKIIENFDTSVRKIDDYYSYNIENLNQGITKAENLSIGNIDRDWITDLNLNPNTVGKFYQGVIRDKGTNSVIDRIGRSTLVNYGSSTVKGFEEWMLRHSHFGDTRQTRSTEILVTPDSSFNFSPSIIDYTASNTVFVNDQRTSSANVFDTQTFTDFQETNKFYSAGPLLETEADNLIVNTQNMDSVYDETANYATIPTWDGQTSYKRGDKVRYLGRLYECDVDYIGYTNTPSDLDFTGSVVSPIFAYNDGTDPNNPSAEIDGLKIYFTRQDTVYDTAIALSTASATLASPSDITIDGYAITLSYTPATTIVDTGATNNGNPYVTTSSLGTPAIADNTGKYLIINGVTIALYDGLTNPPGSSITITDIINYINASDPAGLLTAAPDSVDPTKIFISYDVQGDPTLNLIIGNGTANTDIGLTVGSYPAATTVSNVHGTMTPTIIASIINGTTILPSNYVVDVSSSDELRITRQPTSSPASTMTLTGSAISPLGLPSSVTQTSSLQNAPSTASQAAAIIQNALTTAGKTGITVTAPGDQLRIVSTNASINLGDATNDMNATAGLPGGIHYSTDSVVDNTFGPSDWNIINSRDPALFNIWLTYDGGIDDDNLTTDGILSKFYGWNVLQVQNGYDSSVATNGWYTLDSSDPDECGICAGAATSDGNDARVTLNVEHNLEVGDYVLILNSTTEPSVDGIHKVTKVGSAGESKSFYIDMYIDSCGNAPCVMPLRNARFNTIADMNATLTSNAYIWNNNDHVWVTEDSSGVPSTNVYRYNSSTNSFDSVRSTSTRVTNSTIENVLIYSGEKQQTIIELEVFDPIRGIIPGVADREIDQKGDIDIAVYTHSTDLAFEGDDRNAWGQDQVGKTWWDLGNALYYDYDQGGINYRSTVWGKLIPGASIDVYEWTKSSVAPDEWAQAVDSEIDMYGQIASGSAYGVYDAEKDETTYYYSEMTVWNEVLTAYETVYYFWVKDKYTVPNTSRRLSVQQIANIISDPSNNGISWCAAIGANQFIVDNISYYLSDSSILQVNKKTDFVDHNSWTILTEDKTLIPGYWYVGLRDNIVGQQKGTGVLFPNQDLNLYNRYGDNREIGQGWFTDTYDARREAVELANDMLIHMNLIQDLDNLWDRHIGYGRHVIDIDNDVTDTVDDWATGVAYVVGDLVKFNRKVWKCTAGHTSSGRGDFIASFGYWVIDASIYDLTKMWEWADYVTTDRYMYQSPSVSVLSRTSLEALDTDDHQLALLRIYDDAVKLDRSEIYHWDGSVWNLVEKKNATIQFNNIIWNPDQINLWDEPDESWDSSNWDADTIVYAEYFMYALRHDLFIQQFLVNFNKFFLGMVKYTHSVHKQVDWAYKTTYIEVDIETEISSVPRKYVKNNVDTVLGYINTVKPFHTKIRNVFDRYTYTDTADVAIEEYEDHRFITLNFGPYNPVISTEPTAEWPLAYGGDIIGALAMDDTATDEYVGADFTDTTVYDEVDGGEFLNSNEYNWNDKATWSQLTYTPRGYTPSINRNTLVGVTPLEHLNISCITNLSGNTVTGDSRTFAYMQDNWLNVQAYSLAESKDTTTKLNIDWLTSTSYNIGDIVVYQYNLYTCNTAHTSDAFADDIANWDLTTDEFPVEDETVFSATGGYAWYNGEIIKYGGTDTDKLVLVKRARKGSFQKGYISGATGEVVVDITDEELRTFSRMSYEDNVVGYRFSVDGPSIIDSSATDTEAVDLQASSQGIDF